MSRNPNRANHAFERFAHQMTLWTGRPVAFIIAVLVLLVWAISGPIFNYSDTWQLVINTSTTIVTFLMVFLIQQTQNKDSHSLQLKLNELIAATPGASSRLINVEDLSEDDLDKLHTFYNELVALAKQDHGLGASHSVEEARATHDTKVREQS